MKNGHCSTIFWALLRLTLGWTFFWAFIDKLFGLGFATCRSADTGVIDILCDKAWLSGGSPTYGFLTNATKGPFAEIFQSMAGHPVTDSLFMLGLAGVGISLLLGIFVKPAGVAGAAMMLLMFLAASLLPANNPLIDEHIIYAIAMIGFAYVNAGQTYGLGKWWAKTSLVKKYPFLQ